VCYPDLRSYVRDRQWTRHFLELLEAHFWQSPTEALAMALPVFFGSSLYQPELLSSIYELVVFFEEHLAYPQSLWWEQICAGFNLREPDLPPGQKAQSLQEIRKLLSRDRLFLSGPFSSYQQTFLAALSWQEGEVFRDIGLPTALPCYHEALRLLFDEKDLPEHRARLYWLLAQDTREPTLKKELLLKCIADEPDYVQAYARLGELFYAEKDYRRALKYFYYALELDPRRIEVWVTIGVIHIYVKDFPRALAELNKAITLNPRHHLPYYNRADVYRLLENYQAALEDYTRALEIDPTCADAYINRGNMYAMLKQMEKARMDYEEARRLQPRDAEALWLSEWIAFGKERITTEKALRLYAIAEENPDHYLAPLCRGIFTGITQRDLKLASDSIEVACALETEQADPYFWLAMLLAYRNLQGQAHAALQRALDLGLPIALLQPLYWLEKDAPDFFQTYARPILQYYGI
jgi:tetratricopeptide (TPR) repeat protein